MTVHVRDERHADASVRVSAEVPGMPSRRSGRSGGTPLIRAWHVSKVYRVRNGGELLALQDLNLSVASGEFVSIVGRSGCGKSTFLRIAAGLASYTSGSVELRGKPLDGPSSEVGMVFQDPVLLPWRTVLDNVLLPLQVEHRLNPSGRAFAQMLLTQVGLGGFETRYPSELSGGMQQRTSIARALVRDPDLLLMDEPFGALDALTREQLNLSLQELWLASAKTVVFVTHSIPEALFLSDRVVVFSPRPGRCRGIVEVDLPRPRALDVMTTNAFGEHVRQIRQLLDATHDLEAPQRSSGGTA